MSPFRDYRNAIQSRRPCRPAGRCTTCRSHPAQLRHEFFGMVTRSWSPAEVTTLRAAARSGPETCDGCGPAARAAYRVDRVDRVSQLYLCGPCASRHWPALSAQEWTFWSLGVQAVAPQASDAPRHRRAQDPS
jgi:hypothetical protein